MFILGSDNMLFMLTSIVLISLLGTIAHFLYDLSDHNKLVGLFCAVNESVWEHIKIALTPTILWGLIDGIIYGTNPNYFLAKFVSLAVIIIIIPFLYYGYRLLTKKDMFVIDIMIFYIAIILSQFVFFKLLRIAPIPYFCKYLSVIGLFIIFTGYLIHTFMPGKNKIFKDPITKKAGFEGHSHK